MTDKPPRRKRYKGTHPRRFDEKYKELAPDKFPDEVAKVRAAGRTPAGTHVPVMPAEVLAALDPQPGDVVLDCTLGYGGHTAALWERVRGSDPFSVPEKGEKGSDPFFVGMDLDAVQLKRTSARLTQAGVHIRAHHNNFAGIGKVLAAEGLIGVDCLLADLGLSSMQLDDPARGFGFKHDGPLDMRMDATRGVTAAQLIADSDEEALAELLRDYADEPRAEELAATLKRELPTRTKALEQAVLRVHGLSRFKKRGARDRHPAAAVFQALRMAVNREPANLEHLLRSLPYLLNEGGRAAIITFHSGEERRVREALSAGAAQGLFRGVDLDGIRPTRDEIYANPRSRSARLFTARK